MSRRSRSRQVEIFNFSFLDILACTIGLLIFIMVMVFILQSGSRVADTSSIITRKINEAEKLDSDAARDTQIAQGLEAELDQVRVPGEPDLTPQRDASRAARDAARLRFKEAEQNLATAQATLDEARLARDRSDAKSLENAQNELAAAHTRQNRALADLARATLESKTSSVVLSPYTRPGYPAEEFNVLHVDCHLDYVELLQSQNGKIVEVGRTAMGKLDDAQSDFQKLIAAHRQLDRALVLFWIRPNGVETYAAAIEQLPKPTTYGFEPADADWSFTTMTP